MFVLSPARATNGQTDRSVTRQTYDAGAFSTLAAALAANPARQSFSALSSQTTRASMQKGIDASGAKKRTPYYSLRTAVTYGSPFKLGWALVYDGIHKAYYVQYIEPSFGYVGGNSSGLGDPRLQFLPTSGFNTTTAIANRAVAANLVNQAKVEVASKARNQKLDLSESFVDIDKSVLMVAKRTGQVLRSLVELRRGNWPGVLRELGLVARRRRNFRDIADMMANGWLEISYGWLPLLNDIQAGVRFVNEGLSLPSGYFTASRRASSPAPFGKLLDGYTNPWARYKFRHEVQYDVEIKYRLAINNATMAYLSGIGLDNPAYLAWVGTPFSFVVDWLTPIGPWLQSLTTPLGLKFIDGYMSRRTSGVVDVELIRYNEVTYPYSIEYESPPAKASMSFVELDRQVFTSWPTAQPYFRLPWSNPKRIISSIALLHQANKRA